MAKLKTGRHTSAIKSHRRSQRRQGRNRLLKRRARLAVKAVATGPKEKLSGLLCEASAALDKAAKKGVIHWKAAARKKSRLARAAAKQLALAAQA